MASPSSIERPTALSQSEDVSALFTALCFYFHIGCCIFSLCTVGLFLIQRILCLSEFLAALRPKVNTGLALKLATRFFSLKESNIVSIKEINSYDDRNFLITCSMSERPEKDAPNDATIEELSKRYILKVYGSTFSKDYLNAVRKLLIHLYDNFQELKFPVPQCPKNRSFYDEITICNTCGKVVEENIYINSFYSRMPHDCICGGKLYNHSVGMVTYIPGFIIADCGDTVSGDLLWELGKYIAKVNKCLQVSDILECPCTLHLCTLGLSLFFTIICKVKLVPSQSSISEKFSNNMLYFHPTLFLKDARRRKILHHIPVIILAPD